MTENEEIAKVLKTRLSELTGHLAEIDSELRKRLSADSEERATDLENQDALEGIKNSEIQEIRQIQGALKRIAEGTYGVCVQCGAEIDPKRLKALPIAARCISCAAWIEADVCSEIAAARGQPALEFAATSRLIG